MLPEDPRSKYDQRVKTLSVQLWHLLTRLFSPLSKGDCTSSGHQSRQVQGLQDAEPKLLREHTRSEDVLGCLILLIAERAVCWVW